MKHERLHLKDFYPFLGEDGKDAVVDTYLPFNMDEMNRQNRKRPSIIVCPGGGYGFCSQREAEVIALNYLSEGFNAFVLTYSISPHRFPSQLLEVAALMELIYKNTDEWNCDTTKVAIIGFSAGGHLSAHYSTMFDCKEVREKFPESKSVNATILSYPVITADPAHSHKGSFINLVGKNELEENDLNYFSCDRNVKPTTPPAFIWHTAEDTCVPVENSLLYASALSKNKVPFELHIYPFGCHGLSTGDAQTFDNLSATENHVHAWIENSKKWLEFIGIKY